MIKGYVQIIENLRKDGSTYKRISFLVPDKNTGELILLFNTGMCDSNLLKYEILKEMGIIEEIAPHEVNQ